MADKRILITGGSGRLGSALLKLHPCLHPSHKRMPVENLELCKRWIDDLHPDIIIHCAGFVDTARAESHKKEAWEVNVIGSDNMVRAADGRRFIHISSEYVFDGKQGNYQEKDVTNPINFYGVTKCVSEERIFVHDNSLVLRVPFRSDPPWRYKGAFVDQWTSGRFVSEVAVDVFKAATSGITGILHIGGPRRSIYELAKSSGSEVTEMYRSDVSPLELPRDVSLDSSKWHSLSAQ